MERLIIDIPEKKSGLIKQILKGLGVIIQEDDHEKSINYKQKITTISTWTDNDLKVFKDNKNAFENFKPQQW